MPALNIPTFYGLIPRIHPTALKPGYAQVAHDVDLRHGTLQPWRIPKTVFEAPIESKSMYQWGCCWYVWDKCVEVAEWLPSCPRLYVTGDRPYPTVGVLNDDCSVGTECCTEDWMRLGLPNPMVSILALAPEADPKSEKSASRSYVFTYTNCLCEESAPSWPTAELVVDDGAPVEITGFPPLPDPEWCITGINIYRTASGFRTGREQVNEPTTEYQLVAQVPLDTTSFIDDVIQLELGAVLNTIETMPPNENLRGMTIVPGTKTLVGFYDNFISFSNDGQPWNWPEAQILMLDDYIVSIAAHPGLLYVTTNGAPYVIKTDIACNERACREVIKHEDYKLPNIVCCSNRGIVITPIGAVYVSADGLVLLAGTQAPKILTDSWYAADDWRKMKPETMRLGYYAGYIFCVSDTVSFMLFIGTNTYTDYQTHTLTTFTQKPVVMHTGKTGEMYMLNGTDIQQWNAGNQWQPFIWKSRTFQFNGRTFFSSARVRIEGSVSFTLATDNIAVYNRIVNTANAFRLSRYGRHNNYTVELTGINKVWGVQVGNTFEDISQD